LFGHNIQALVIYERIVLRLPLGAISQSCEELFDEPITDASIANFILRFGDYYVPTESILLARLLASPFIHADETKINVQGADHYIWVLTDGIHVVFRITETRTSAMVQEILKDYDGTLISDFYGAYDAVDCRYQKCLVHLIRDLNDDLWKNPFNSELERFIAAFKELLMSIMAEVQKYGLKKRNLQKHKRVVERYYNISIDGCDYEDEIVQRYQKRIIRYRDSLFRFLESDGIPWNNNMAERAIRHLAIQRKISGTIYKKFAEPYLRLLSVAQSCGFQHKSFLSFMLSEIMDVDQFKKQKHRRISELVARPGRALNAD